MLNPQEPNFRILIVEDDPVSAMVVVRSLELLGYEADVASTAEEALERFDNCRYHLMIADWMLPGIDGIELCRHLRELPGPYCYFLLCSAKEDRAIRLDAFDAGVDDFLSKPLDRDELRARLLVARRILANEERMARQRDEVERSANQLADLNESLKVASRRFEDLFNGLPVACFTFDPNGFVHEWNRAAEEAFGVPAYGTLQRPAWEVLGSNGGVWSAEQCERVFQGPGVVEFDWTYTGLEVPKHFACRIIAMRGRNSAAVGAVCANVDVTERKNQEISLAYEKACLEDANARLHDLASNDGLTGLWNRRSFLTELESACAAHRRDGRPFSLILLDIDRFKQYNDTFGHPAGDEVLRRFARVLKETAREGEHPSRYGGEEFAIVLFDTDSTKAVAAAERYRKAVESAKWRERPVTCSLGVATCGHDGTDADALIEAADLALYASKQAGRNRVTYAGDLRQSKAA